MEGKKITFNRMANHIARPGGGLGSGHDLAEEGAGLLAGGPTEVAEPRVRGQDPTPRPGAGRKKSARKQKSRVGKIVRFRT